MGGTGLKSIEPIARIESPYRTKFGVPRQAGLVEAECRVVMEEKYRVAEALRGIEDFEYLWLVWGFDRNEGAEWTPTVRPPRLGGNKRVGVFATRSPFRPNGLGLSCVRLVRVANEMPDGVVLYVAGADLTDGTPIYDIKPYLPYTDSHEGAKAGFAQERPVRNLQVEDPEGWLVGLADAEVLKAALEQDPRPHYHNDPQRVYVMEFGEVEVHFRVDGEKILIEKCNKTVE